MTDRIEVDYAQLEKIIQQLRGRNDHLDQHYNHLLSKLRDLDGRWEGKAADKFFDEMADKTLPAYRHLMHVLAQTQSALAQVATTMRAAEEQAGNLFKGAGATGEFGAVGGGFGASAGVGVGASGNNNSDNSRVGSYGWFGLNPNRGFSFLSGDMPYSQDIQMGKYPSFLRNSMFASQTEILRQYLAGDMDFKTAHEFLRFGRSLSFSEDGRLQITDKSQALIDLGNKDSVLSNYVDASAKLEFLKIRDESTTFERIFGNENANLRFSALSVERELTGRLKFEPNKIDLGIEGTAGAYLTRLQGSAEMNGFKAMGDAYIGATASGQAGVIYDPHSHNIKATLKGEAFIGAEAKGSLGFVNDLFSIELQGNVAAGAGVRGQFDVSFHNGRLKLDVGLLGALGVGGGAGVKVDVNLNKVADIATESVGDAFKGVSDLFYKFGNKDFGNAAENFGNLFKNLF